MTSAQSLQSLIDQYPEAGEVVFGTTRQMKWTREADQWVRRPFDLTKSATGLSDRPAIRESVNE